MALCRLGAVPTDLQSVESLKLTFAMLSDIGCRRRTNEDSCNYVVPSDRRLLATKGVLGVVADGMGGHAGGETASALAIEVITRTYFESLDGPAPALENAFQMANRAIYAKGESEQALKGLGSTCTAAAIVGNQAFWAHVGDTRLYFLRGRKLVQLTRDDTEVRKLQERGWISERQARRHPQRNILCRALGVGPEIDHVGGPQLGIRPKDCFILCSDGLHDVVMESELCSTVKSYGPNEACRRLIGLARDRGAPDNITVLIIGAQSEARIR